MDSIFPRRNEIDVEIESTTLAGTLTSLVLLAGGARVAVGLVLERGRGRGLALRLVLRHHYLVVVARRRQRLQRRAHRRLHLQLSYISSM